MKKLWPVMLSALLISTSYINISFAAESECQCEGREDKWKGIAVNDMSTYFKTFDISKQDQEFNGHTVHKHIGKSKDWLDGRLAGSRHEKFVSSYTDLDIASTVIKEVILENESRIKDWMDDKEKDKLVLSKRFDKTIGVAMKKKDHELQDCNVAVIVLKRPHKAAEKFYIVTSYPVVNIGDVESEHKEWKAKNNDKYPTKH